MVAAVTNNVLVNDNCCQGRPRKRRATTPGESSFLMTNSSTQCVLPTTTNEQWRKRQKRSSKKKKMCLVISCFLTVVWLFVIMVASRGAGTGLSSSRSGIPTYIRQGRQREETIILAEQTDAEQHEDVVGPRARTVVDQPPSQDDETPDLIHLVLTRLMQHQPDLHYLANARLQLFESICVPSLVGQTTQDFYWIIQTDPDLKHDTLRQLKEILAGARDDNHKKQLADRVFLLASNDNLLFNILGNGTMAYEGDMSPPLLNRTRMLQVLSPSKDVVLMGNGTLLRRLVDDWTIGGVPLLQTRLDADDALERSVLKYYQDSFRNKVADRPNFFYFWCLRHHLEWYPSASEQETSEDEKLILVSHFKLCETPGLTLGTRSWGEETAVDIPLYDHDVLYKQIASHSLCQHNISHCFEMVPGLPLSSFRTRTWTSAGMLMNHADKKSKQKKETKLDKEKKKVQEQMSKHLSKLFNIFHSNLKGVTKYLTAYELEIAQDNLRGQCTEGHSCKETTVAKLRQRIQTLLSQRQQEEEK